MTKNKTTETTGSVSDFIGGVADETKRTDSFQIVEIMKKQTGLEPKMWGPSIVGFGSYHYKYDSGHEGDAPLIGFSPRAGSISLYMGSFPKRQELLQKFGKHKVGKGCIYVNKLKDIDQSVFEEMVTDAFEHAKTLYPTTGL